MMIQKLLRFCLCFFIFSSSASYAAKFDFMAGMFSLDATAGAGKTSVSSVGSYRTAFSKSVLDKIDVLVGYTLNMTNTIGGDMAYGIDFGFNYFPFTFSESKEFEKNGISIKRDELYRPYIGLSFNQRQFQSIKNSYAGFGLDIGCEYSMNKHYSFKAEFRYITLGGSSDSNATEMNMLAGISLKI